MAKLALAILLSLAACKPKPCQPTGDVAVALVNMPNTLDWNKSSPDSWANYPVMHALMRGLTTLDEHSQPVPDLAERWDVETTTDTPPRQIYTFHLRPDVLWSDGKTPLTAEDFVFGWRRALAGNGYSDMNDLLGWDEVSAATTANDPARRQRAIEAVAIQAIDSHTLRVTLKSPRVYFLSRIALVYTYFPAPSAALAGKNEHDIDAYFNEPADGKPLTLGAYHVESWDRLGGVHLAPNASSAKNGITQLTLVKQESQIQYDHCEAQFYAVDDAALLGSAGKDVHRQPLMSTYWLGMNVTSPELPLPLRRAISHAVDREKAVAGLVPDVRPAFAYLPPELDGAVSAGDPLAKDLPVFDPAAAKREVAESGYKKETVLKLLVATGTSFMPELGIADNLRLQLEAAGITVEIVGTAQFKKDILLRRPDGAPQYPLFLKRIGADFAHPETFFSMFEPGANNYTDWASLPGDPKPIDAYVAILTQGAAETDPARMKAIYTQAQKMLLTDYAVLVPIYHPDRYYLRRPWLEGLGINPFNFLSFRSMHVGAGTP